MVRYIALCLVVAGVYAASAQAWHHGWRGHVPQGCSQLFPRPDGATSGTIVHGVWVPLNQGEVLLSCTLEPR